jgi:hypothetical protein
MRKAPVHVKGTPVSQSARRAKTGALFAPFAFFAAIPFGMVHGFRLNRPKSSVVAASRQSAANLLEWKFPAFCRKPLPRIFHTLIETPTGWSAGL